MTQENGAQENGAPENRAQENGAPENRAQENGAQEEGSAVDIAVDDEETEQRVSDLLALIELIRPAVQADGGDLVLVSVDTHEGVVEVMLQGACSSCAISTSTLKAGIERIVKDRLPWVTEVNGGIDEDADLEVSAAMGRGSYVPKEY